MRMKKKVFLAALVAAVGVVAAPRPLDLNGTWEFRFEEGKSWQQVDAAAFTATDPIIVPGCFDAMPKWFMKRGTGLYRRTFTLDEAVETVTGSVAAELFVKSAINSAGVILCITL